MSLYHLSWIPPPSPPRSLQDGALLVASAINGGAAPRFLKGSSGVYRRSRWWPSPPLLGRATFCLKLRTYFDLLSLIHCFKGLNPVRAFWGASPYNHHHLRVTYRREQVAMICPHGVIAVNWHPNFVMGKLLPVDSTLLEIATFWEAFGRSRYTSMHHHETETAPLPVLLQQKITKSRATFPWLVL